MYENKGELIEELSFFILGLGGTNHDRYLEKHGGTKGN